MQLKTMLLFPSDNADTANLRTALVVAVIFHLILAISMPNLAVLSIPHANRASGINVFLTKSDETESFEQSLNHLNADPSIDQELLEPALGAASATPGDDSFITEEAPLAESQPSTDYGQSSSKRRSNISIKPVIRIDRATIKAFAKQETIRYMASNKDELERFKNSFNSSRSYQRRTKTESYKNNYGDYYVRTSTSDGDICFVQKQTPVVDDFSTNTVYFHRCGTKPKGLDIAPKG